MAAVRRRCLVETTLVLAVGLGQSAVFSLLAIIERLTRGTPLRTQTASLNVSFAPDRPWLDLAYQLCQLAFQLAPCALALFLLATVTLPGEPVAAVRTGSLSGALRSLSPVLGLDRAELAGDLLRGVALALLIGVPGIGIYLGARALGVNTTVVASALASHWWTVPMLILAAAGAALAEEGVMIGYLFARWGRAGVRPWRIVVLSALIRGGYHLYQGFGGFLGNLAMGLVFGLIYRRKRRLMPLICCHFLLDVGGFVGYALLHGHVSWL